MLRRARDSSASDGASSPVTSTCTRPAPTLASPTATAATPLRVRSSPSSMRLGRPWACCARTPTATPTPLSFPRAPTRCAKPSRRRAICPHPTSRSRSTADRPPRCRWQTSPLATRCAWSSASMTAIRSTTPTTCRRVPHPLRARSSPSSTSTPWITIIMMPSKKPV